MISTCQHVCTLNKPSQRTTKYEIWNFMPDTVFSFERVYQTT